MDNVHESGSTQIAATHETTSQAMPEHSTATAETAALTMTEHSTVVEHAMPTVETTAQVMPEHSVVVEHPMPIVETTAPIIPEHSMIVEHPILTVIETEAMGHIVGLASTFTRIIVEAHGNTMPMVVETAAQVHLLCYILCRSASPINRQQPSLTTFVPAASTFASEVVATEPARVIVTESTRFQGNQTAIAIGTTGTNTRINSPAFTGGAADNVGSGKVYGVIGAVAVGFVMGML